MRNIRFATALSCLASPLLLNAESTANSASANSYAPPRDESWFYSGASAFSDEASVLSWRNLRFRPSINYKISHSSGKPGVKTNERGSTTIQRLSPSLSMDFREGWTLRYVPTWTWYSSQNYADKLSHDFDLRGVERIGLTQVSVAQSYVKTNESSLETAQQTNIDQWSTTVGFTRPLNARLSMFVSGNQDLRYTDRYTDTREYSATAGVNYLLTQPLVVGVNASSGYNDVDPGPNSRWHRAATTVQWQLSTKISVDGSVGYEDRKTATTPAIKSTGPVYSGNVNYKLTDNTTLYASTTKTFGTSLFQGATTERTRYSAGLRQILLQRLTLNASLSEGDTKYKGGTVAGRSDKSSLQSVSLSIPIRTRLEFSAFYHHTKNRSNRDQFDISTEEYGASASYRF